MPHTRRTLELDEKWDLMLTAGGDIALANDAFATAQNVANEARLFLNDAYFTQDQGAPYYNISLGQRTNSATVAAYWRKAASNVDDVRGITELIVNPVEIESRNLTGDIRFSTVEDNKNVSISLSI